MRRDDVILLLWRNSEERNKITWCRVDIGCQFMTIMRGDDGTAYAKQKLASILKHHLGAAYMPIGPNRVEVKKFVLLDKSQIIIDFDFSDAFGFFVVSYETAADGLQWERFFTHYRAALTVAMNKANLYP